MNWRVTRSRVDLEGKYQAEVRRFESWPDATLWFGYLLAEDNGSAITLSNERTGIILAQTTEDYRVYGTRG